MYIFIIVFYKKQDVAVIVSVSKWASIGTRSIEIAHFRHWTPRMCRRIEDKSAVSRVQSACARSHRAFLTVRQKARVS